MQFKNRCFQGRILLLRGLDQEQDLFGCISFAFPTKDRSDRRRDVDASRHTLVNQVFGQTYSCCPVGNGAESQKQRCRHPGKILDQIGWSKILPEV